jgi:hypothetical protein
VGVGALGEADGTTGGALANLERVPISICDGRGVASARFTTVRDVNVDIVVVTLNGCARDFVPPLVEVVVDSGPTKAESPGFLVVQSSEEEGVDGAVEAVVGAVLGQRGEEFGGTS